MRAGLHLQAQLLAVAQAHHHLAAQQGRVHVDAHRGLRLHLLRLLPAEAAEIAAEACSAASKQVLEERAEAAAALEAAEVEAVEGRAAAITAEATLELLGLAPFLAILVVLLAVR